MKKPTQKPAPPPTAISVAQDDPMEDPTAPGEEEDSDIPNGDFDFDFDEDDEELEDAGDVEDDEDDDSNDDMPENASDDISEGDEEGGVAISNGRALSPSSIPILNQRPEDASTILSTSATETNSASLNPQKPTPYVPDAGHMLITDPNPLPQTTPATIEATLASTARDAVQSLLNHMLTTCPIHRAPATSASSSGITMILPPPVYALPREKKIPQPKAPTKWETFAARKGIGKHNKKGGVGKNGDLQSTEGKMVYDEATGEWVPKWGYKGKNKKGEGDWLVEVDEKKEKREGKAGDARSENRAVRKEKIRRNDRAQRANERKSRKGKSVG